MILYKIKQTTAGVTVKLPRLRIVDLNTLPRIKPTLGELLKFNSDVNDVQICNLHYLLGLK